MEGRRSRLDCQKAVALSIDLRAPHDDVMVWVLGNRDRNATAHTP
jgi:hypothetical protein